MVLRLEGGSLDLMWTCLEDAQLLAVSWFCCSSFSLSAAMDQDADLFPKWAGQCLLACRCFVIADFLNSCTVRLKNNIASAGQSGMAIMRFVLFTVGAHVYMQDHRLRNHRARKLVILHSYLIRRPVQVFGNVKQQIESNYHSASLNSALIISISIYLFPRTPPYHGVLVLMNPNPIPQRRRNKHTRHIRNPIRHIIRKEPHPKRLLRSVDPRRNSRPTIHKDF